MNVSAPSTDLLGVPARAGRFRAALDGAREMTPMVIGVAPFGLAIGAAIGASDVTTSQGVASAGLILAGAAQHSVVNMLEAGATPLIIVLSALMINARLVLYSASLAPWFSDEPLRRRLVLAGPVIDQLYFTCLPRFQRGDLDASGRRWFYAGGAGFLVASWVAVQAVAIAAGATLPAWTGLHIAAPLALAGLMAKSIQSRAAVNAAGAGALVAVFGVGLPFHSAVLVATLIGIAAGTATERRAIDAAVPEGARS